MSLRKRLKKITRTVTRVVATAAVGGAGLPLAARVVAKVSGSKTIAPRIVGGASGLFTGGIFKAKQLGYSGKDARAANASLRVGRATTAVALAVAGGAVAAGAGGAAATGGGVATGGVSLGGLGGAGLISSLTDGLFKNTDDSTTAGAAPTGILAAASGFVQKYGIWIAFAVFAGALVYLVVRR